MDTKDIVIYQAQDGDISINVLLENETVWLPRKIASRYAISHLGKQRVKR